MTGSSPKSAAESLERIAKALRLQPNNARLLLQRAQCLLALGRAEQAREGSWMHPGRPPRP